MGLFSNDNGKKLREEENTNLPEVKNESTGICLISKETLIKGTIETASMFQIEGVLEGDIKGKSLVHIGITGKVIGNVTADSVLVDGEVSGEVVADRMEIGSTGKAFANISSAIFVIQEGGIFEGTKKTKKITEPKVKAIEIKNEEKTEGKAETKLDK